MNYVYDIETFPNCFQLCATNAETGKDHFFEISARQDDTKQLIDWVYSLRNLGGTMVGFNNVGFDYPVLHFILQMGKPAPAQIYEKAISIIKSEDKFSMLVRPSEYAVRQVDLFKIHHFDNKARMTSLKALEFNMRLSNIEDLPFPVGTLLTRDQMTVLGKYCANDVRATLAFFNESREKITFREELTKKHGYDFINANDTKIGAEIFRISLEKAGVPCYSYGENGRSPRQTPRSQIRLADCIPSYIHFNTPEFERIRAHLCNQVITETKGVFKDLSVCAGGVEWVFGTGGIHASVEQQSFISNDTMVLIDKDVTSMYPSIAITNGFYPEHLGRQFVTVYEQLKEQRTGYGKKTSENAMLKLALNGVYGKSNDKFSIFYDPQFTMQITLTGQMCLAMLAEELMTVGQVVQGNTDGVTLWVRRDKLDQVQSICQRWEKLTGLMLEEVEYSRMHIADVNSYIAVSTKGDVKRKGRYEYDLEWHQDASALVIAKVAEQVLLYGAPIRKTVEEWPDFMDFMLRVKVNRGSKLVWLTPDGELPLENTQRYYVSKGGYPMTKIMPPLAKAPTVWRRIAVQSGYTITPCNDILNANQPIDFDWYINEVEKLCLGVL